MSIQQESLQIEELKRQMRIDPDGLAKRLLHAEAKVAQCEELIAQLLKRVEELEARLNMNNRNSSTPPFQ